jgi:hypothetical protein
MSLRSALSAITSRLGFSGKESVPPVKPSPTHPPTPVQAPTSPATDGESDLIAVLSRTHGQLRALMVRILELAEQRDFNEGRKELQRFETMLARHLEVEDNGFFNKLKSNLPDYAGKIQRCQADLQGVTKELRLVSDVCEKESDWPAFTTSSLERLFDRVEERFTYEENSLFPVYLAIDDNRDVMNKTQIFDRSLYARLKSN